MLSQLMPLGENRSSCPAGHMRLALGLAAPKRAQILSTVFRYVQVASTNAAMVSFSQ